MMTADTRMRETRSSRAPALRRGVVILLFAASLVDSGAGASIPLASRALAFQDGEVLRYKVKWGFLRLATIELSQKALGPSLSTPYEIRLRVNATRLQSTLSPSSLMSLAFVIERGGERTRQATCRYDPDLRAIFMEERESNLVTMQKTVPFDGVYVDLVGLIMAMRSFSASAARISLPTVVGSALRSTELMFAAEAQAVRIGLFQNGVRARHVRGETNWKALAGVSGPIEAWVSDDAAAVPLKIRLNSSLGRLTLELEAVQRTDWQAASTGTLSASTANREATKR